MFSCFLTFPKNISLRNGDYDPSGGSGVFFITIFGDFVMCNENYQNPLKSTKMSLVGEIGFGPAIDRYGLFLYKNPKKYKMMSSDPHISRSKCKTLCPKFQFSKILGLGLFQGLFSSFSDRQVASPLIHSIFTR